MHDERWRLDLAQDAMRLHVEGLVEQWAAELETRRVSDKAARGQFVAGRIVDAVVVPVRLVVDETLLVVEQWVEQDHAMQQAWMVRGEVSADAAAETRPDEADRTAADRAGHLLHRGVNVVEHARDRQILLPALALPVRAVIKAQARQAGGRQAFRQAGEEPPLLARDAPAVYENDRRTGGYGGPYIGPPQPQPIKTSEGDFARRRFGRNGFFSHHAAPLSRHGGPVRRFAAQDSM